MAEASTGPSVYANRKLASTVGAVEAMRRVVFDGSVPCSFSIGANDIGTSVDSAVNELYMQVSRVTYLPVIVGKIKDQLLKLVLDPQEAATISTESIWFSIDNEPLKWHWPLGLLADYHNGRRGGKLPVRITVHLKNFPSELIPRPNLDDCRLHYMNRLKESDFVRYGTSKKLMNVSKDHQDLLWNSLVANDFQGFHSVFEKLVPLPAAPEDASIDNRPGQQGTMNSVKSVPIRVYVPSMKYVITDVAPPVGEARTISLQAHISKLLPRLATSISQYTALVQGIPVPLNSDIGWLGSCLVNPDGWVNVVLF